MVDGAGVLLRGDANLLLRPEDISWSLEGMTNYTYFMVLSPVYSNERMSNYS